MSFFYHFDRLSISQKSHPYPALHAISWRAGQILNKRSKESFSNAAEVLNEWIAEFKETQTKEKTDKFIDERVSRLLDDGGWELHYLSRGEHNYYDPLTAGEIRDLFENWPSDADDRPDFPTVDDIDDLDALHDILCSGYPFDDIDGFKGASESELYAVLALMQLEDAASKIRVSDGSHESIKSLPLSYIEKSLIHAANELVRAMETVCYAERELSSAQLNVMREDMKQKSDAELRKAVRRETAREGGLARNTQYRQAQEFVKREWGEHSEAYENNKSAFARHYARRVKNELQLTVTEKTIREVWLVTTPTAGKTAR